MIEKIRKTKGITLIALVITIIVLLILAGVSITTLVGSNGILDRASQAKTNTIEAEEYENTTLDEYANVIDNTAYNKHMWEKFNIVNSDGYKKISFKAVTEVTNLSYYTYESYTFSEVDGFVGEGTGKSWKSEDCVGRYIIDSKTSLYKVVSQSSSLVTMTLCDKAEKTTVPQKGTTTNEIVESFNKGDYPISGAQGSYWYEYIGIKAKN